VVPFHSGDWTRREMSLNNRMGAGERSQRANITRSVALALNTIFASRSVRAVFRFLDGGRRFFGSGMPGSLMVDWALSVRTRRVSPAAYSFARHARSTDAPEMVKALLHLFINPQRIVRLRTRNAREDVAEALHADYLEFDVNALSIVCVNGGERFEAEITWAKNDYSLGELVRLVFARRVWLCEMLAELSLLLRSDQQPYRGGCAARQRLMAIPAAGSCPIGGIDKRFSFIGFHGWHGRAAPVSHQVPFLNVVTRASAHCRVAAQGEESTDEG